MTSFLKRVLSTVTGIFVFLFICFFMIAILGLLFSGDSKGLVQVKPNSILELKLDFPIKDYAGKIEFKEFPFFNESRKDGLFNLIDAIEFSAIDDNIKGISIDNNFIQAGISQTKALRDALLKFKKSGKFIVAYADVYSQKDYYLSSLADTVYINPSGILEFKGLYSERLYFKKLQEKTGVKMEVVRHGKYKSAVEPFLENEMSDNNREQISVYLNSIWNQMKTEISESRQVSEERLNVIADSLLTRNARLAKKSNLIDKVAYHDEYVNGLKNAVGIQDKDDLEIIEIKDYAEYTATRIKKHNNKTKIAVIYAEGEIIYGEGDEEHVGQGTMSESLKEARNNSEIKAVVLRINSPGGSALASELIWREIELTKKIKPVIVSMGNLAASGGYYIACNANKIIAEPTTITGSIGVFGVLPNGEELSKNIGINAEQVTTNKNTILYSFFEPLSKQQHDFIKEGVVDIYELFTNRVAVGRKMNIENVNKIAQGRVWTGVDALKNGLVDELGGLDLALKRAKEVAEIENYDKEEFPVFEKEDVGEVLLNKFFEESSLIKTKETILKEELGEENYMILKNVKAMSNRKGIQLIFPFSTEIK